MFNTAKGSVVFVSRWDGEDVYAGAGGEHTLGSGHGRGRVCRLGPHERAGTATGRRVGPLIEVETWIRNRGYRLWVDETETQAFLEEGARAFLRTLGRPLSRQNQTIITDYFTT